MTQSPNPQSPIRIALWCAVSSRPQAGPGKTSLQDQERAGRDFAAAVGGHVVAVYTVPGHTRDLVFWPGHIPAYAQLRADLEPATRRRGAVSAPSSRPWDVLHAIDVDRLGRDPALSNQVISLVERAGAEVYLASAPHPIGQHSTGLRYVHAIQSVRAKEAQDRRVQGQHDGMIARVRRGLPACHWPIGYTPIRHPDTGQVTGAELDDLAPAVLLITDLFLKGEPYNAIRDRLNAGPYRPPRSSTWTYSTIHSVMQNTIYAGYPTWKDARPDQPSDKYPLLWDAATYTAIRRELARRAPNRAQRSTGSPVGAICYCARCGSRMHRTTSNGRQPRLRCGTQANVHIHGRTCHANSIVEATVVQAIADHLVHLVASVDDLDHALQDDEDTGRRDKLAQLQHQLDLLEGKRRRLAHAFAAGKMDLDLYHVTDTELKTQAIAIEEQTKSLQEHLEATPTVEERRAAILALAEIFPDLVATAPPQRVRALLQNAGFQLYTEAGVIVDITP